METQNFLPICKKHNSNDTIDIVSKLISFFSTFKIPLIILLGIILYLLLGATKLPTVGLVIILGVIFLGSYRLVLETIISLIKKQFALDYIAILAVLVSLLTREFLVGAVIALMLASGETLEDFGAAKARQSLTKLIDRIPRDVWLWQKNRADKKIKLESVKVGQHILIRKGEVIPLDGVLNSKAGITDESSLTGEPYPVEKIEGDIIRSGTVNIGDAIVVKVTKASKDSTYRKIITLVESAQQEKAPLVRLADRYSTIFTIITFTIAGFAFWHNPTLESILAVLVVATPCPLIIATPIALLGGVNAAAKKRIIIKKLASIEVLARVNAIILDKTGTITLGKPRVTKVEIDDSKLDKKTILSIAEAIERSSLHPLAKAIVAFAASQKAPIIHAVKITEKVGVGISGTVNNKIYTLSRLPHTSAVMSIEMREGKKRIAIFSFEDEIKEDSKTILEKLKELGVSLSLFTGDKKAVAEKVASQLGGHMDVHAEATPEEKQLGIATLKKKGRITAMVGDGINDAPALAQADVGMVFSSEEQTASTNAADIVFLGGNFSLILESMTLSKRTIGIALQSILWGIGLSIGAMILAAFGFIPPLYGAILQEGIDVVVIINALRASR